MNEPASVGKTTAIAGLGATQAVTLLIYVSDKIGLSDMTPEVAGAIIGFATMLAGAVMHDLQRRQERRERAHKQRAGDRTDSTITTGTGETL